MCDEAWCTQRRIYQTSLLHAIKFGAGVKVILFWWEAVNKIWIVLQRFANYTWGVEKGIVKPAENNFSDGLKELIEKM